MAITEDLLLSKAGALGDMWYRSATGLVLPVAGVKATGKAPLIQSDGSVAWETPPVTGGGGGGGGSGSPMAYCSVKRAAAINPLAGNGYFAFDTEVSDTSGMHDNATNPSRVNILVSGRYVITAQWANAVLTNMYANINLRKNGATVFRDSGVSYNGSGGVQLNLAWVGDLVAGDYVELGWSVGGSTQTVANGPQMEVAQIPGTNGAIGTLTPLSSTVLGAAAATIPLVFPGGYRDVTIVLHGRGDTAVNTFCRVRLRLNGSSTAGDYDWVRGNDHDSGVEKEHDASLYNAAFDLGVFPSSTGPASYRGMARIHVGDYLNTTFYKSVLWDVIGTAVGEIYNSRGGGHFKSAAALATGTLLLDNGNFVAGTVMSMYGAS